MIKLFKLFFLLSASSSFALSLISGDRVGRQSQSAIYEPLDWILNLKYDPYAKQTLPNKSVAYNYIGFLREGQNLEESCSLRRTLLYKTPFELDQVKRSIISTLQYIGLDFTVKAIANYSKEFELEDQEFKNLVDNLVGNYCSVNTTVISLKQLKKNFYQFKRSPASQLPSIKKHLQYFPKKLLSYVENRDGRKREFYLTTELFKAFCSWGNDATNLRLLVPIVRNPYIMAYVNREMAGMGLAWNSDLNRFELHKQKGRVRVNCAAQICRRSRDRLFEEKMPKSIGSLGLLDDFNAVYCAHFRQQNTSRVDEDMKILKEVKGRGLDEEKFFQSQFVALLTGIPDTFVNLKNFAESRKVLMASVEGHWNLWSKQAIKSLSNKLSFEESLSINSIPRYLSVNPFEAKFRVVLEITLGELDRVNYVVDKISVDQKIYIPKSFLKYIRDQWVSFDERIINARDEVVDRFALQLKPEIQRIKTKFVIAPWEEGLDRLIAYELLEQIAEYDGNFFESSSNELVEIPLEFRYGQFALRYMRYRFKKLTLRD